MKLRDDEGSMCRSVVWMILFWIGKSRYRRFWAKNGVGGEIWWENYGDFLLDLDFWAKNGDFGGRDWTPGF